MITINLSDTMYNAEGNEVSYNLRYKAGFIRVKPVKQTGSLPTWHVNDYDLFGTKIEKPSKITIDGNITTSALTTKGINIHIQYDGISGISGNYSIVPYKTDGTITWTDVTEWKNAPHGLKYKKFTYSTKFGMQIPIYSNMDYNFGSTSQKLMTIEVPVTIEGYSSDDAKEAGIIEYLIITANNEYVEGEEISQLSTNETGKNDYDVAYCGNIDIRLSNLPNRTMRWSYDYKFLKDTWINGGTAPSGKGISGEDHNRLWSYIDKLPTGYSDFYYFGIDEIKRGGEAIVSPWGNVLEMHDDDLSPNYMDVYCCKNTNKENKYSGRLNIRNLEGYTYIYDETTSSSPGFAQPLKNNIFQPYQDYPTESTAKSDSSYKYMGKIYIKDDNVNENKITSYINIYCSYFTCQGLNVRYDYFTSDNLSYSKEFGTELGTYAFLGYLHSDTSEIDKLSETFNIYSKYPFSVGWESQTSDTNTAIKDDKTGLYKASYTKTGPASNKAAAHVKLSQTTSTDDSYSLEMSRGIPINGEKPNIGGPSDIDHAWGRIINLTEEGKSSSGVSLKKLTHNYTFSNDTTETSLDIESGSDAYLEVTDKTTNSDPGIIFEEAFISGTGFGNGFGNPIDKNGMISCPGPSIPNVPNVTAYYIKPGDDTKSAEKDKGLYANYDEKNGITFVESKTNAMILVLVQALSIDYTPVTDSKDNICANAAFAVMKCKYPDFDPSKINHVYGYLTSIHEDKDSRTFNTPKRTLDYINKFGTLTDSTVSDYVAENDKDGNYNTLDIMMTIPAAIIQSDHNQAVPNHDAVDWNDSPTINRLAYDVNYATKSDGNIDDTALMLDTSHHGFMYYHRNPSEDAGYPMRPILTEVPLNKRAIVVYDKLSSAKMSLTMTKDGVEVTSTTIDAGSGPNKDENISLTLNISFAHMSNIPGAKISIINLDTGNEVATAIPGDSHTISQEIAINANTSPMNRILRYYAEIQNTIVSNIFTINQNGVSATNLGNIDYFGFHMKWGEDDGTDLDTVTTLTYPNAIALAKDMNNGKTVLPTGYGFGPDQGSGAVEHHVSEISRGYNNDTNLIKYCGDNINSGQEGSIICIKDIVNAIHAAEEKGAIKKGKYTTLKFRVYGNWFRGYKKDPTTINVSEYYKIFSDKDCKTECTYGTQMDYVTYSNCDGINIDTSGHTFAPVGNKTETQTISQKNIRVLSGGTYPPGGSSSDAHIYHDNTCYTKINPRCISTAQPNLDYAQLGQTKDSIYNKLYNNYVLISSNVMVMMHHNIIQTLNKFYSVLCELTFDINTQTSNINFYNIYNGDVSKLDPTKLDYPGASYIKFVDPKLDNPIINMQFNNVASPKLLNNITLPIPNNKFITSGKINANDEKTYTFDHLMFVNDSNTQTPGIFSIRGMAMGIDNLDTSFNGMEDAVNYSSFKNRYNLYDSIIMGPDSAYYLPYKTHMRTSYNAPDIKSHLGNYSYFDIKTGSEISIFNKDNYYHDFNDIGISVYYNSDSSAVSIVAGFEYTPKYTDDKGFEHAANITEKTINYDSNGKSLNLSPYNTHNKIIQYDKNTQKYYIDADINGSDNFYGKFNSYVYVNDIYTPYLNDYWDLPNTLTQDAIGRHIGGNYPYIIIICPKNYKGQLSI